MMHFEKSKADTACKLECLDNQEPVHEFVGPVKIIVMNVPKGVYAKRAWLSAAIGLSHILLGVNVFTVLFYTLSFKTGLMINMHIVECTIAMQLFMPAAILMHNSLHGPAAPLKPPDRKCQHFFLQIWTLVFGISGLSSALFLAPGKLGTKILNVHAMAGVVSLSLCLVAALIGPIAYAVKGKCIIIKSLHGMFGSLAFLASSVCFCTAIFTSKTFKAWTPLYDLPYILIVFCAIYTLIVIITLIMKTFRKIPT